jgi:hypothetical protein
VKTSEGLEVDLNNFNALRLVDRGFQGASLRGMEVKDHKGIKVGKILAS